MISAPPIRLIAALLIALFTGQAPAALAGEAVVICGDAAIAAYDFEKGEPASPSADIGWCDNCISCPIAALPSTFFAAPRHHSLVGTVRPPITISKHSIHTITSLPRGPPAGAPV